MKSRFLTVFLLGSLCVWVGPECGCRAQGEAARTGGAPKSRDARPALEAVAEQRYYLSRLFGHYGQGGRISSEGLHRLLMSLGLGQVQVVEIEHEKLGHAHVSHLDALELQERKHIHSHTTQDHLSMLAGQSGGTTGPDRGAQGARATTASSLRSSKWTKDRRTETPAARRDSLGDAQGNVRGRGRLRQWRSMGGHRTQRSPQDQPLPAPSHRLTDDDRVLNHSMYNHLHENCLNVTQLLVNFGLSDTRGITPKQFTYICPALLYQIDSRLCIQHHDSLQAQPREITQMSVWLSGFIAITLISLTSLLAVAIIPLLSRSFSKILLRFLVTLAIGTLSADALLHLIPHSRQLQRQEEHSEAAEKDSIWKGLSVLGGIYLLFLIETLLGLFRNCRVGKAGRGRGPNKDKGRGGKVWANKGNETELQRLAPGVAPGNSAHPEDDKDASLSVHVTPDSLEQNRGDAPPGHSHTQTTTGRTTRVQEGQHPRHSMEQETHGHSHGRSHRPANMRNAGIATIAWMVIVGDGAHNFTDGLAIGAAFSTGISGGLSTAIAVFCHELPHELGDFAVLLRAGLTLRQVVVFNLVSALVSYLGLAVGIAIGQHTAYVTPWIFTGTAGIFLYVSLVDMLPEMIHAQTGSGEHSPLGMFLSQNLGFLLGVGTMLCIALFENKLQLDISF